MEEASKAIQSLKRASNYTKLAFHEFGPKSYKRGQGALLKVVYKFGENGSITKKTAEKILNWRGKDLRSIAKKAEKNGYVTIDDPDFKFNMSLTEKGKEVIAKRLDAEDRTADTILEGLTDDEVKQLIAITDKISKTCEGLGIDYSVIEKKEGSKCCKKFHKHHHGGCGHGHDHHGKMHGHRHEGGVGCHKHHHCHHHGQDDVKYIFIFGDKHGHHCHH